MKAKDKKEDVITHLQIIHTWASFALKRGLGFFNEKHMERIVEWTQEVIDLLKGQVRSPPAK